MELCNGLKIELEIYRRGEDQALFDFYFGLYKYVDEKDPAIVREWVQKAREQYPYRSGEDI